MSKSTDKELQGLRNIAERPVREPFLGAVDRIVRELRNGDEFARFYGRLLENAIEDEADRDPLTYVDRKFLIYLTERELGTDAHEQARATLARLRDLDR